jgi:purine-nucleoside phosphorylase
LKKALRESHHYKKTYEYIITKTNNTCAEIGIILGTGLGGLVKDINITYKLDYSEIPYFPVSTVESHHGNFILGEISGIKTAVMQGRFHYYENYTHEEITYPIQIMKMLGVKYLIVSNACGGLNPNFKKADLMIMQDHINFQFDTPLKNKKLPVCNRKIYDSGLIAIAEQSAKELGITLQKGVYLSLHGPVLETKAEYRMIRKFGADAVGMSTMPEALFASNSGIKILGLSIVTDMGIADTLKPAVLEEILEAAAIAEPNLTKLTEKIIENISLRNAN